MGSICSTATDVQIISEHQSVVPQPAISQPVVVQLRFRRPQELPRDDEDIRTIREREAIVYNMAKYKFDSYLASHKLPLHNSWGDWSRIYYGANASSEDPDRECSMCSAVDAHPCPYHQVIFSHREKEIEIIRIAKHQRNILNIDFFPCHPMYGTYDPPFPYEWLVDDLHPLFDRHPLVH